MTANELTEIFERINQDHTTIGWETLQFVAPLLRQQAQEIEALKKELALQKLSDIGQEIENKPSVQKSEMSTERELTNKESE
jgi:hypothetical protein